MATQAQEQPIAVHRAQSGRWVGGLVLITLGGFALIAQLMPGGQVGILFMPMLGGIFLAAALGGRNAGLLVPGGILSGLGTGIYLLEEPGLLGYAGFYVANGPAEAGILLLSLAGGFALIALLSPIVSGRLGLWPLFPATIIGAIGGMLLAGDEGLRLLKLLGMYWPVALIALGLLLIVRRSEV